LRKLLLYIYWVRDLKPSELKGVLQRSKLEQYEELTMTTAERLISEGIQQGIEQGIEKGIEQGIEQEKLETAGKMLKKGIDLKTILEITGLTEQDLRDSDILSKK
ncbi:Rpn family recombination-promoting nuclease/putative transposase, partial [Leptospira weilii]|uniref:Rpn family recombination-promoting nuclease/putative transposase n=1 Tax=Leptospira weilii TaxID=28184 RepID=UPI000AE2209B